MALDVLSSVPTLPGIRRPVIAVDLHGTLADKMPGNGSPDLQNGGWHDYDPAAYVPQEGAREALQSMWRNGFTIIVWTCWSTDEARKWLQEHGFQFDGINEEGPNHGSVKIDADAYVDDKAVHHAGDWEETLSRLAERLIDRPATKSLHVKRNPDETKIGDEVQFLSHKGKVIDFGKYEDMRAKYPSAFIVAGRDVPENVMLGGRCWVVNFDDGVRLLGSTGVRLMLKSLSNLRPTIVELCKMQHFSGIDDFLIQELGASGELIGQIKEVTDEAERRTEYLRGHMTDQDAAEAADWIISKIGEADPAVAKSCGAGCGCDGCRGVQKAAGDRTIDQIVDLYKDAQDTAIRELRSQHGSNREVVLSIADPGTLARRLQRLRASLEHSPTIGIFRQQLRINGNYFSILEHTSTQTAGRLADPIETRHGERWLQQALQLSDEWHEETGKSVDKCDHGPNQGKPGPCPSGGGERLRPGIVELPKGRPGAQLPKETKKRLLDMGMVGSLPKADVPPSDIKVHEGTPEELRFRPLITWTQTSRNGKRSRQSRYTQEFHDRNAAEKFRRVLELEPHLTKAKAFLGDAMTDSFDTKEGDAAAIASLMMETGLRPDGAAVKAADGNFGASSLLLRHVKPSEDGKSVTIEFPGKGGLVNRAVVTDPANVDYLTKKLRSAGPDATGDWPLWQANANDARGALQESVSAAGGPKDAQLKDLRTVKATQLARQVAESTPAPDFTGNLKKDAKILKQAILRMSGAVARQLNVEPAEAKNSHIHPEVWKQWQEKLNQQMPKSLTKTVTPTGSSTSSTTLSPMHQGFEGTPGRSGTRPSAGSVTKAAGDRVLDESVRKSLRSDLEQYFRAHKLGDARRSAEVGARLLARALETGQIHDLERALPVYLPEGRYNRQVLDDITHIMLRGLMEPDSGVGGYPEDYYAKSVAKSRGRAQDLAFKVYYHPNDEAAAGMLADELEEHGYGELARQVQRDSIQAYRVAQVLVSSDEYFARFAESLLHGRALDEARRFLASKSIDKGRGQPCKQGESAARSGCIPRRDQIKPSGTESPYGGKPDGRGTGTGAGIGRGDAEREPQANRGELAEEAGGPGDAAAGAARTDEGQPVGPEAADRLSRVLAKLDKYEARFTRKGMHAQAGWMADFRASIEELGVDEALMSLGEERASKGDKVQYLGAYEAVLVGKDKDSRFIRDYLDEAGVQLAGQTIDPNLAVISGWSRANAEAEGVQGLPEVPTDQDYIPGTSRYTWEAGGNKLEEAKALPGLESSEDIHKVVGGEVTHFTPDVIRKLDEAYGNGQWIVKSYGEEAYAGFGIFFPQRVAQIKRDSKALMSEAKGFLKDQGYTLVKDGDKVTGIKRGGRTFNVGTEEFGALPKRTQQYTRQAVQASNTVRGAALPATPEHSIQNDYGITFIRNKKGKPVGITNYDGKQYSFKDKGYTRIAAQEGSNVKYAIERALESDEAYRAGADITPKFMVQPAFKAVGVSDADRAAGNTWETATEGRVHCITRDGRASAVPYATLAGRGDDLPATFEDENIKAMQKAVEDAINALPESERAGQLYAPDVMKTKDGWKVIELNPSAVGGGSDWLGRNPFVIDALTSYLTGKEPQHVSFVRGLLKGHEQEMDWASGRRRPSKPTPVQEPTMDQPFGGKEPKSVSKGLALEDVKRYVRLYRPLIANLVSNKEWRDLRNLLTRFLTDVGHPELIEPAAELSWHYARLDPKFSKTSVVVNAIVSFLVSALAKAAAQKLGQWVGLLPSKHAQIVKTLGIDRKEAEVTDLIRSRRWSVLEESLIRWGVPEAEAAEMVRSLHSGPMGHVVDTDPAAVGHQVAKAAGDRAINLIIKLYADAEDQAIKDIRRQLPTGAIRFMSPATRKQSRDIIREDLEFATKISAFREVLSSEARAFTVVVSHDLNYRDLMTMLRAEEQHANHWLQQALQLSDQWHEETGKSVHKAMEKGFLDSFAATFAKFRPMLTQLVYDGRWAKLRGALGELMRNLGFPEVADWSSQLVDNFAKQDPSKGDAQRVVNSIIFAIGQHLLKLGGKKIQDWLTRREPAKPKSIHRKAVEEDELDERARLITSILMGRVKHPEDAEKLLQALAGGVKTKCDHGPNQGKPGPCPEGHGDQGSHGQPIGSAGSKPVKEFHSSPISRQSVHAVVDHYKQAPMEELRKESNSSGWGWKAVGGIGAMLATVAVGYALGVRPKDVGSMLAKAGKAAAPHVAQAAKHGGKVAGKLALDGAKVGSKAALAATKIGGNAAVAATRAAAPYVLQASKVGGKAAGRAAAHAAKFAVRTTIATAHQVGPHVASAAKAAASHVREAVKAGGPAAGKLALSAAKASGRAAVSAAQLGGNAANAAINASAPYINAAIKAGDKAVVDAVKSAASAGSKAVANAARAAAPHIQAAASKAASAAGKAALKAGKSTAEATKAAAMATAKVVANPGASARVVQSIAGEVASAGKQVASTAAQLHSNVKDILKAGGQAVRTSIDKAADPDDAEKRAQAITSIILGRMKTPEDMMAMAKMLGMDAGDELMTKCIEGIRKCDHGPNKGKPGPCPQEGKGDEPAEEAGAHGDKPPSISSSIKGFRQRPLSFSSVGTFIKDMAKVTTNELEREKEKYGINWLDAVGIAATAAIVFATWGAAAPAVAAGAGATAAGGAAAGGATAATATTAVTATAARTTAIQAAKAALQNGATISSAISAGVSAVTELVSPDTEPTSAKGAALRAAKKAAVEFLPEVASKLKDKVVERLSKGEEEPEPEEGDAKSLRRKSVDSKVIDQIVQLYKTEGTECLKQAEAASKKHGLYFRAAYSISMLEPRSRKLRDALVIAHDATGFQRAIHQAFPYSTDFSDPGYDMSYNRDMKDVFNKFFNQFMAKALALSNQLHFEAPKPAPVPHQPLHDEDEDDEPLTNLPAARGAPKPGTKLESEPGHRYRYSTTAEHTSKPNAEYFGGTEMFTRNPSHMATSSQLEAWKMAGVGRTIVPYLIEFKYTGPDKDWRHDSGVKPPKPSDVKRVFVNLHSINDPRYKDDAKEHIEELKRMYPKAKLIYVKQASDRAGKTVFEVVDPNG